MVQIHACKMCVQANDTSIGTHKILLPLSFAAFMERGGGGWEGGGRGSIRMYMLITVHTRLLT